MDHRVRRAGKSLEIVTLDLAGEPNEVLSQIKDFAGKVRKYRAAASSPTAA